VKEVVIGVLCAIPQDSAWGELVKNAAKALEEARGKLSFLEADVNHRRGKYPAFAVGLSHGGGQKVCFL
jgi:hypothetical protein